MDLHAEADFSEWENYLARVSARVQNPAAGLERVGAYVAIEVRGNIADGGGAAKWPPLKAATLEQRARRFPGAGDAMLVVTRELFNSITHAVNAAEGYVDIGSALAKAKTLFFGHGPVPARSPFVFRDRVYERIATMLGSYFFMGRA